MENNFFWHHKDKASTKEEAFRYCLRELQRIYGSCIGVPGHWPDGPAYGLDEVKDYAKEHGLALTDSALADAIEVIEGHWTPSSLDCGYNTYQPAPDDGYKGSF
jgi:hypothetical protein